MNIFKYILAATILPLFNISYSQVIYDTIPPEEYEIGGWMFEDMYVFKDYESATFKVGEIPEIPDIYPHTGRVFIQTTFGRDGKMNKTAIVRSSGNPIFDSLAFHAIEGIKGWMPGMTRGRFVDIPVTLPVNFENDSLIFADRMAKMAQEIDDISQKKYNGRKELFDFVYSDNPEQRILPDLQFLAYCIGNWINEASYTYVSDYYNPYRVKKAILKTDLDLLKAKLLIIDFKRPEIVCKVRNVKRIVLQKGATYLLVAYQPHGDDSPLLSIKKHVAAEDSELTFSFHEYTKKEFTDELNKLLN